MTFIDIFAKSKSRNKIKQEVKQKIIIDLHEKNSLVASELVTLGCEIEFKHLEVGDYIVKNVVIERKTVSDFISSMLSKRLINQLQNMQSIKNKILIIEGIEEQELYNKDSNLHENAVRGFLLSIILHYNVPIILTKDYEDTAKFISVLSKKQVGEISLNLKRKSSDVNEQIRFIIESFPGIGPKSARKLLNEFKTIKNIINTDLEQLEKILGKKAEVFKMINLDYKDYTNET
ncbi:MAG: ERCC4 domain-containing protein [Nanoarchaeota archaeon]